MLKICHAKLWILWCLNKLCAVDTNSVLEVWQVDEGFHNVLSAICSVKLCEYYGVL